MCLIEGNKFMFWLTSVTESESGLLFSNLFFYLQEFVYRYQYNRDWSLTRRQDVAIP